MEYKIADKPMASVLKVKLNRGEAVNAQPGAMMLMMGDIKVETSRHLCREVSSKVSCARPWVERHSSLTSI